MTWNFVTLGYAIFIVGLVPWSIGSLISFRTRHDVHNRRLLTGFKFWDKEVRARSRELTKEVLTNPKSRWWSSIGGAICVTGMAVLMLGCLLTADPASRIVGGIGLAVLAAMIFSVLRTLTR